MPKKAQSGKPKADSPEPKPAVPDVPNPPPPARGRQSAAPVCPYCSTKDKPVRCVSKGSSSFFTRYYCPTEGCSFSIKVARPSLRRRQQRPDQEDFAARP